MPRCLTRMPLRMLLLGALSAAALLTAQQALAGGFACGDCGSACGGPTCGPEFIEKTVYCPTWVNQTKTVNCTVYKPVQYEKTITCYRVEKEVSYVEKEYTTYKHECHYKTVSYSVNVPEYHWVEKTYNVSVPYYEDVQQQYTVCVPSYEKRTAHRTVCKRVPYTTTRKVCVDQGQWVEQTYQVPCGVSYGCGGCGWGRGGCGSACGGCGSCEPTYTTCTRRVWQPNIVTKEVPVTCYKTVQEQVPYEYTVCVPSYEQRTRTVKVCKHRTEQRTKKVKVCSYKTVQKERQVPYSVCVPVTHVRKVPVCNYKKVPYEKTLTYTKHVPETVQREVTVRVCQMVPKTIQVPCYSSCGGGGCFGGRLFGGGCFGGGCY